MNVRNRHLINVLSTGIVVTVATLAALFWARWYCHLVRVSALYEGTGRARISPIGVFPFERADDPNLTSPSSATAELNAVTGLFTGLGAVQYVMSHVPGGADSHVYRWEEPESGPRFYFDPSLGLMVYAEMSDVQDPNGSVRRRYVTQFAGPEGVAQAPDENLGRFVSPISDRSNISPQPVYDKGYRRFFAIHWQDGLVKKGPEVAQEDVHEPIQIGTLQKNWLSLRLTQRDPLYTESGREGLHPGLSKQTFHAQLLQMDSYPVLVLNASGRIDLLHPDTLALMANVGHLPTPPTLFRNRKPVGPEDVAAYCVYPLAVYQRDARKRWAYAGLLAATASRDLTGMQLAAFDPNGYSVATQATFPDSDEAYFSIPGASLVTAIQFAAENLHPLAFLLLSSLTASEVPATSSYSSLVVLPNSFAAMAARDADLTRMNRFASSLLFMLPAIVLGVFLAWRVSRDAGRMGLSRQASAAWILGAFLLGLPAYLTYRLTRPKAALVTCGNCGLGRRADLEKCQRCGAPWIVAELVPPSWRVIGEPEEQAANTEFGMRNAESPREDNSAARTPPSAFPASPG